MISEENQNPEFFDRMKNYVESIEEKPQSKEIVFQIQKFRKEFDQKFCSKPISDTSLLE